MSDRLHTFDRVSRRHPCPICGKTDWCLLAHDGGAAICPRTEAGGRYLGEAGWLHALTVATRVTPSTFQWTRAATVPTIDAATLQAEFREAVGDEQFVAAADHLCVSAASLERLGMGWARAHRAYTFPMFDARRRPIGLRLRAGGGRKWAIEGSRNGLFIPEGVSARGRIVVVEGPTDCAAVLDWGVDAIGRPSANACVDMTCEFCEGREVVILANFDEPKSRPDGSVFHPGQDGAERLADALLAVARWVRVVYPLQGKDARQWRAAGGTAESFLAVVRSSPFWTPSRPLVGRGVAS